MVGQVGTWRDRTGRVAVVQPLVPAGREKRDETAPIFARAVGLPQRPTPKAHKRFFNRTASPCSVRLARLCFRYSGAGLLAFRYLFN